VQNPLLITSFLNFSGAVPGFSSVPPNDKRLIFNHRNILKEIVKFVNKVENKQKEYRLQVQVTGAG
jgi:hypothetical protein